MGLFNRLGREIEQFRQDAKKAAAETEEYECEDCGARFQAEYEECPECGAEEVTKLSNGG